MGDWGVSQELLERQLHALEAYNAWETGQVAPSPPRDLFAQLDFLRNLLLSDHGESNPDPNYLGILALHAALSKMKTEP